MKNQESWTVVRCSQSDVIGRPFCPPQEEKPWQGRNTGARRPPSPRSLPNAVRPCIGTANEHHRSAPSTRCKRSRALVTHGERPLSFGIWTNSTSVAGTDFAMSHSGSLLGSKGEEEHAGGTMVLGAPLYVGHCKSLRRRAKRLVPFDGPCARFATTITRVPERQSPRRLAVACGRQRAHRSVLWAKQWNTVRGFARNPSGRGVRIVACLASRHRATTRLAKPSTQLDVDF